MHARHQPVLEPRSASRSSFATCMRVYGGESQSAHWCSFFALLALPSFLRNLSRAVRRSASTRSARVWSTFFSSLFLTAQHMSARIGHRLVRLRRHLTSPGISFHRSMPLSPPVSTSILMCEARCPAEAKSLVKRVLRRWKASGQHPISKPWCGPDS